MLEKIKSFISNLLQKSPALTAKAVTDNQPLLVGRPMKFPYTFTAKIAHFPYKFHMKNNWIFRYYIFGVLLSAPLFYYIQTLANKPSNVEVWKEIRRKESEEHAHHHSEHELDEMVRKYLAEQSKGEDYESII